MDLPVILHIPHASTFIPEEYLGSYLISPSELEAEKLKLTDLYTDELYQLPGAMRAEFPVSRFFTDAERFSDDALESMAARGMGALYTVTTDLKPLRAIPDAQTREEILQKFYWPHHKALDDVAARMLETSGKCLLIDCHSYPSKPLPYELENCELPRPQIGIGTDSFHTPDFLGALVVRAFEDLGYETGLNMPFAGSLVPSAFYGQNPAVQSFMIEIRKDLYMDEATGAKKTGFDKLRADLTAVMALAAKAVSAA